MVNIASQYFSLALQIANLVILAYAGIKFLGKPGQTLRDKVADLEKRLDKLEEKINGHDDTIEVLLNSQIALIDFEIQYCYTQKYPVTDDLKDAKDNLNKYLAHKKGD